MKKFKFLQTFERFGPAPAPSKPSPSPEPGTIPAPRPPVKPLPPTQPEPPVKPITPPDEDEKPLATEEDVIKRLMYELDKKNMTLDEFKEGEE